jgi:low density lipoprotein receptor-related protein 5/6
MSERSNVYEQWLGISSGNQPPSYYQILGLRDFESDAAEIANAAKRQLARVEVSAGPAQAAAAKALEEQIRMAERCLLTPETKTAYDRHLQAKSVERLGGAVPPAPDGSEHAANPIGRFSLLAASLAILVFVVGFFISARRQSRAPARDAVSHATTKEASPGERALAGSPGGIPPGATAETPAKPAHVNEQQSQQAPPSSSGGETASRSPSWLRLDEHGEPCEATLTDGSVLMLDTYGKEYQGYDFRPPVDVSVAAETVVDYAKVGRNVELYAIQIDATDRKMYWIEMHGDKWQKLSCANLNGDDVKIIVNIDYQGPMGLALDTVNRKIYWTSRASLPTPGRPASAKNAIWRANFDGSEPEPVFDGLGMPRAVAVDPASKSIFYFDDFRLIRGGMDGKGEKLLLDQVAKGLFYPPWWTAIDPIRNKLYWVGDDTTIASINLDGSGIGTPVSLEYGHGHFSGIALDLRNQKIYWTERSYQEIWRANLDGSQVDVIALGLHLPRGIDLDADGFAYWTDYKPTTGGNVGKINRIKLPPVLKPRVTPAPPLIDAVVPTAQRPGGEVTLRGKGFTGTIRVQFVTDTGKPSDAQFLVKSDTEIAVTVPMANPPAKHAALVVQGAGGVTVTLPRNASLVGSQTVFDRFRDSEKQAFVVASGGTLGGVEHSVVYGSAASRVQVGGRGGVALFLKNDARTVINDAPGMVIFHEPFVQMQWRAKAAPDAIFVPVPAIRPSFVESLFEYQSDPKPMN